jgi:hypothetical protein
MGLKNKIKNWNIGNNQEKINNKIIKNKVNFHQKFYQKEGFWSGVLTGVISSLITSGLIWLIKEFFKTIF